MPRLTPAFIVSILAHLALLGLALIAWPEDPPPEIVLGAVPVSVVSDVRQEAAPAPTPAETVSEEPPAESPVEMESPEPPTPTPTPPRPTPPRQTPPRETPPRPTPPRETPPRPTPPRETPPRPTPPRPTPPRETPPRPTPPREDALDLDAIAGGGRPSDRTRPGAPSAGESGQGQAPVATGPQIAAIGRQVVPHWNLNCEVSSNLTIRMRVGLSAQGTITSGPTLVRPEDGAVWRAAADSALRAMRAAAPFDVPEGFRAQEITFVFDSATACRGR